MSCAGSAVSRRRELPPELPWEAMPDEWVSDGVVRLAVAKGTLVPASELHAGRKPTYDGAAPKRQRRAQDEVCA